ncbi:MAG: hypothetical protein CTY34_04160 [Methylobacter sp.]|nr:MAG: hypothetical protein CTY34_04160 [Methylobacter sp.]PPD24288.1 MAG: hypothetical protein CTY24_01435 [Methylobacter sp.]PPD35424.1 MAG: hypothetical protein CTY18_06290 [Methylomonas sp.]
MINPHHDWTLAHKINIQTENVPGLNIECINLVPDETNQNRRTLVADEASETAYVIVQFRPSPEQETQIGLFVLKNPLKGIDTGSMDVFCDSRYPGKTWTKLERPCRFVFKLPPYSNPRIPSDIDDLLEWAEMRLNITAPFPRAHKTVSKDEQIFIICK